MRVLGLVPARGGSKGVPRKNIRELNGRPLLSYTAESALASKLLDRVVLTTDDDEIASIGRRCGLEVPFRRPQSLAQDETPMLPVVQHALSFFAERGYEFDAVFLLQPVTPFRSTTDIDSCVDLMIKSGADTIISVLKVPERFNPLFVYFENSSGGLEYALGAQTRIIRRQQAPTSFVREGSVYLTKTKTILECNSIFGKVIRGYQIADEDSVNIDSEEDWRLAERILRASNENSDRRE